MNTPLLILPLLLISLTADAQYQGGSGTGTGSRTANGLALGIATMYAGGTADGTAMLTGSALSLVTSSQYSGGSNDGHAAITQPALSLATPSSYNGGANDGAAPITASALSLSSAGMYAGGSNVGFNGLNAPALPLGMPGSYSGGSDDGASALLGSALNLNAPGMYAGGSNDGNVVITASALPLYLNASMYAGGGDDGFSRATAPALSIALPITWEDFTLGRRGIDAVLHWQVGNERNDMGFDVERSYDGGVFSKIAFVQASNGLSSLNQYEYTDTDPAASCPGDCRQVYYRLRQISLGGEFSFSPIRKLGLDARTQAAYVYPNPAADKIIIQVNAMKSGATVYDFALYNGIGVVVYSKTGLSQAATEIDVHAYPSGSYYLRLFMNGVTYPYHVTITH